LTFACEQALSRDARSQQLSTGDEVCGVLPLSTVLWMGQGIKDDGVSAVQKNPAKTPDRHGTNHLPQLTGEISWIVVCGLGRDLKKG